MEAFAQQLVALMVQHAVGAPPAPAAGAPAGPAAGAAAPAPTQPAWVPTFETKRTQDYTEIYSYYTQSHWGVCNDGTPHSLRQQTFTDHAIKLGCYHPSERTCQTILACYRCACQGDQRVRDLTALQRHALLVSIKEDIKRAARRHGIAPALKQLPPNPVALQAHDQSRPLWQGAFAEEAPVVCPFAVADLRLAMDSFRLRMDKTQRMLHQQPPPIASATDQGLMAMMRMMSTMQANFERQAQQGCGPLPGLQIFAPSSRGAAAAGQNAAAATAGAAGASATAGAIAGAAGATATAGAAVAPHAAGAEGAVVAASAAAADDGQPPEEEDA